MISSFFFRSGAVALSLAFFASCKNSASDESSKDQSASGQKATSTTEPAAPKSSTPTPAPQEVKAQKETPKAEKKFTLKTAQPGTQPFTLEDFSQIKTQPDMMKPKLGDTIYTMETLPSEACGEYWILEQDGSVNLLAVCTHGDDEHHKH